MNNRETVRRLEKSVKVATESPVAPPADSGEGTQLAREVIRAFVDDLATYRRVKDREPERIDPHDAPDWQKDFLLNAPPEEFTFVAFERLARIDPELATRKWDEVKATARRDVDSGWLAARALESMGGSAWERATFLAVRERLRRAWLPRNEIEALLIDEMTQYEMLRLGWLRLVGEMGRGPETLRAFLKMNTGQESLRPFDAADATLAGMRMVERFQQLFHKTLQSLVNLRRGKSTFIAQRSGQLNVALGPQANVCRNVGEDET